MIKRKEVFTQRVIQERITLRPSGGASEANEQAVCEGCGGSVRWLSAPELTAISGADSGSIASLISNGDLDIRMSADRVLICSESVMRCLKRGLLQVCEYLSLCEE